MELVDGGRLCKKCDKVMIDFRGMDDYEIASIHINSDKVVCGVYDEYRLNDNPNFTKPKLKLNTLYLAGMFGLLANSQVEAQTEKAKTIQTEPSRVSQDSTKSEEIIKDKKEEGSKILRGIVLDNEDKPVWGMMIYFKEIGIITYSDNKGYFEVDIKEGLETNDFLTLKIAYVGKTEQEIYVSENNTNDINIYYVEKYEHNSTSYGDIGFAPAMEEKTWYRKLWDGMIGIFD